ncbi:MAG: hypothetical protein ACTSXP_06885, partial [Promethearchaeota archaeon]
MMIRFKKCPKCGAQVEEHDYQCWNCNHIINESLGPPVGDEINMEIGVNQYQPYFIQCKSCGAQNELSSTHCWNCGVQISIPLWDDRVNDSINILKQKKHVPFEDVVSNPPQIEQKKKRAIQTIVSKVGKVLGINMLEEDQDTNESREKDRRKRKAGKLILFHCPKCNGYFKVSFIRVHGHVKCPVCKDTRMLIPYYCARCKKSYDYRDFGHYTCPTCNIT